LPGGVDLGEGETVLDHEGCHGRAQGAQLLGGYTGSRREELGQLE
jgi:hypothetical protein